MSNALSVFRSACKQIETISLALCDQPRSYMQFGARQCILRRPKNAFVATVSRRAIVSFMNSSILIFLFPSIRRKSYKGPKTSRSNFRRFARIPKGAQNQKEHTQMHFPRPATCGCVAASLQNHNRPEPVRKERGPGHRKPKCKCIHRPCVDAFCFFP